MPSSSLIPDDPSVLLTTAGMQQFKKYFTGKADPIKDFGSKNTVSIQKSFRTSDIDEVGDESHLTFFEMLGNFSFGGYFKEEAIRYAHDFFKEIGLPIEYVTIFGGDSSESGVPSDEESEKIWKNLGISRVEKRGREDNFWGPTGNEGPCGPTTEIYLNGVEVWNLVFNEYYCNADGSMHKLDVAGVDTGMGLERLAMIAQGKNNIFETDLFMPILELLPSDLHVARKRIAADHMRGAAFLFVDGVQPSNKEAGYVLRRILRRVLAYERTQNISPQIFENIFCAVISNYKDFYHELEKEKDLIINEYWAERERFTKTLPHGLKRLHDIVEAKKKEGVKWVGREPFQVFNFITGAEAFDIYQTYGLTEEVIMEELANFGFGFDKKEFEAAKRKHQEISRAGIEKKFGGHGLILNTGELKAASEEEVKIVIRLHTATHLLQAALRAVLGPEVEQRGSDITAERTRFDFSFSRKLTGEEKKLIEDWVNDVIKRNLPMMREEMSYEEAIKSGALHFFREKYPECVNVYSVVDQKSGEVISRELCGGPHVSRTGEIGHFRIAKEEAVSAGTRRIRAIVE